MERVAVGIISAMALVLCIVCMYAAHMQRGKSLAEHRAAELERELEAQKIAIHNIKNSAAIDAALSEHEANAQQKVLSKVAKISLECDTIHADIDDRLRQLALDAYRAAVLCDTTDASAVHTAGGAED